MNAAATAHPPRPAAAARQQMRAQVAFVLYLLAAAAGITLPLVGGPLAVDLMLRTGSVIILAISWNLAANAGLISLGHSTFWGLGSYTALLIANRLGLPFVTSLIPAAAIGALVGSGLAVITGRLRGIYFAVATLALSEGLRVVSVMLPDLTGGSAGLYIDQALRPAPRLVAVATTMCAVMTALVAHLLSRTPFHYACRAMRNNEHASQMLGVNPLRFRIAVLALSGGIASLAGGINIWYTGFLDPDIGFDLHITILAQIGPILGGIHSLAGPIIGGMATIVISELSRIWLGEQGYSLLVYGVILVVSIMFMPHGIYGSLRRLAARRPRRPVPVRAREVAS